MVIETDLIPFSQWIGPALISFGIGCAMLLLLSLSFGYLTAAVRHGPLAGGDITFRVVQSIFTETLGLSPRRIWAIARLAIKESLRKQVLAVLVINVLVLMFASWLLDPTTSSPALLYLRFLLNSSLFFAVLVGLFLSCFSLPADLKSKTIYTVVTKPVSASEIVLGRMLGFAVIGTVLLAAMAAMNYVFVIRSLQHTHAIDPSQVVETTGKRDAARKQGKTTLAYGHEHEFWVDAEGHGRTDMQNGHDHEVTLRRQGDRDVYEIGPPEGQLTARVPIYGKLSFLDRAGVLAVKGINVGNEWTYRGFIEGGTRCAATFKFSDITAQAYPDGVLPLAMTVRVFRSYKGDIRSAIKGSLQLRNPETQATSQFFVFRCKDAMIDEKDLRDFTDPSGSRQLDLFKDLVASDHSLEIVLRCEEAGQYFGVAQPDMWLRVGERSFASNYVKGYIGIWLRMVLIIGFGVMFSTFLAGPVATIATIGCAILGMFRGFIAELLDGMLKNQQNGGGAIESIIRIFTQANMVSELEDTWTTAVVRRVDQLFYHLLDAVTRLLPNLVDLGGGGARSYTDRGLAVEIEFVAQGFDISADQLWISALTALGYLVGMYLIGYFFLKTREVGQ